MVGMIVARAHSPMTAVFGIPAQGQLLKCIPAGPVQVGTGVISGAHYVIDLLLHHVDFFSLVADLITALVVLAVMLQHGEAGKRRLMVVGVVAGVILDRILRPGAIKGPSHAGKPV